MSLFYYIYYVINLVLSLTGRQTLRDALWYFLSSTRAHLVLGHFLLAGGSPSKHSLFSPLCQGVFYDSKRRSRAGSPPESRTLS